MTLRFRLPLALLVALVMTATSLVAGRPQTAAGAGASASPQAPAADTAAPVVGTDPATAPLSATIPTDRAITTGTFANGLRYYIRRNGKPDNRAELRLVVNAGSVLEEDDQRGLAHFVEHMAFNGTTHFPGNAIFDFAESIGMRIGPSVNASTSFDETIYQLQVPTDDPAILDRAMLVMEDWAHNVTFDPVEVDKERGVIIEEWRLRRGAAARLQDVQFPVLLADSRYAVRNPIGTVENLRTFPVARLKQFYTDWYRPDLMAVIAVGDFDPPAVEALIRRHFEPLPKAVSPRPRPVYTVPPREGTTYTIASDPELTVTQVEVYNTENARDESTIGAYRDMIVVNLFTGMLNARFDEIARKPDAPFIDAGAGRGNIVRTTEATMLSAVVRDNEVERGLGAMFEEAERVARFGFTATELERQKAALGRAFERLTEDRDNHDSADYAAEYGRNFLTTEPIPGILYEHALYERFLPEITLDEINALAKDWSPDRNRVVLVSAPDRPGITLPTQASLAAVMENVASKELAAFEDVVSEEPLLDAEPAPGRIVATNTRPASGITEWTLSNGARVVLKPTTFRQDEILVRAFSPGGHSLVSDEDFIPASTASQIIAAGGVGRLSQLDLRKKLSGKIVSVRPSIGPNDEGLNATGSRQDLESLFQWIYLTFTAPRADPEIFGIMLEQTRQALVNQQVLPEYAFSKALNEALTQDNPRARQLTLDGLQEMNLDRSLAIYKDRFADASDFTFVFVGSFEPDLLRPYVERYLASLPALDRKEAPRDLDIHPAPGVTTRRVEKGIEPKSQTAIVFEGPFEYTERNRTALRAMAMALEGRLRSALREDLGGTYSVSVSPGYSKIPSPEFNISIGFGSDPTRTDALAARVFQEIALLEQTGPTPQEVSDIRETLLRQYEENLKQNGFLLANIAGRYENGEDVDSLFSMEDVYRSIDAKMIHDAANTYLDTTHYVEVKLFPENMPEPLAPADAAAVVR